MVKSCAELDTSSYWNHGAGALYGWTAQEAAGRIAHELLKTVFPVALEEVQAEVVRTGRWESEVMHTRKDGSKVVVSSRWALQQDEQGLSIGFLVTNNDITEQKRVEEASDGARRSFGIVIDNP